MTQTFLTFERDGENLVLNTSSIGTRPMKGHAATVFDCIRMNAPRDGQLLLSIEDPSGVKSLKTRVINAAHLRSSAPSNPNIAA